MMILIGSLMSSTTFDIHTPDGLTLLGRRWTLAGAARAALIIHGVGEHSGRYDEVAGVLNAAGFDVMSYDQRGFGQSDGDRGRIPNALALVTDAAMVFGLLQQEHPTIAPLLAAHSMGGAVAAVAVTSGAIQPSGLLLSSPAIRPRVDAVREDVLRHLLRRFPDLPLSSLITPEQVTHDTDVQRAIRQDPWMHTTVSPRLIVSIIDQGRSALAAASNVRVPALFVVAGNDKLVHPEASREFATAIGSLAEFHEFPELFHEVFNERPADRAKVFSVVTTWLTSHPADSGERRRV